MDKKEFYDIVKDAVNDAELCSRDIPPIELYVDQILNLMSERIEQGSTRYHEKQLTKTMINNYSKEGLITPVKGKKYNKEQILQMLMVYTLKGTLSIGEIKRLLDGAYESEGFGADSLTDLYDGYLKIKQDNRDNAVATVEEILDRNALDIDNDIDYIKLICVISAFSSYLKNIAQAMIDARFPEKIEPADVEKEKEEKKEEKKERKEEKKADKRQKKEEKKEIKESKKEK